MTFFPSNNVSEKEKENNDKYWLYDFLTFEKRTKKKNQKLSNWNISFWKWLSVSRLGIRDLCHFMKNFFDYFDPLIHFHPFLVSWFWYFSFSLPNTLCSASKKILSRITRKQLLKVFWPLTKRGCESRQIFTLILFFC